MVRRRGRLLDRQKCSGQDHAVSMPSRPTFCNVAVSLILLCFSARIGHADWQRDTNSLAWRSGTNVIWQLTFDPNKGKPFFHPVAVAGGPALTNFKPEDHPWHYGLWFSW